MSEWTPVMSAEARWLIDATDPFARYYLEGFWRNHGLSAVERIEKLEAHTAILEETLTAEVELRADTNLENGNLSLELTTLRARLAKAGDLNRQGYWMNENIRAALWPEGEQT